MEQASCSSTMPGHQELTHAIASEDEKYFRETALVPVITSVSFLSSAIPHCTCFHFSQYVAGLSKGVLNAAPIPALQCRAQVTPLVVLFLQL